MPVKIIDEKGKIFGKVNIIDLLVILLAIAAAAFFVQRKYFRQLSGNSNTSTKLTYQVQVTRVEPVIYETVKQYVNRAEGKSAQMFSSDTNTFLDAFLVDCEAKPHVEYVTTSDGQVKRVESSGDDQRLDLIFTLEAQVTNPNTNAVGTQQVRVGIIHYLKTTYFELQGSVIKVEKETS